MSGESGTGAGTGVGAGGAGGNAGAGGAGGDSKPWFDGADQDTIGYLQNRGLDKGDAKTAALAAIKGHREAERFVGAPADQLIRLPKDGNDPAWRSVYNKLGVPTDAKDYDFKEAKFTNGDDLGENFTNFLRDQFHKANVSKTGAIGLTREFVKYIEGVNQEASASQAAEIAKQQDQLKASWGRNYNVNLAVAESTARKLGVAEETLDALRDLKGVGQAGVLELFRSLGEKMGEHKFVGGAGGGEGGPMTAEAAVSRLTELKADKVWVDKFHNGDSAAKREFDNLTALIAAKREWVG